MIDLNTLTDNRVKTIPLTAVIDTALCVGAGGSDGSLADKPIVRNAKGQLLIPASQLKGRLRHECEKLARGLGWQIFESPAAEALCPREDQVLEQFRSLYKVDGYRGYHCFISKIFGNPILPSRIVVEDLICNLEREDLPEVLRPGVTINRSRRTAEDQKLFRNLVRVADTTDSAEVIKNFIRYQVGRDKKWGRGEESLAARLIQNIDGNIREAAEKIGENCQTNFKPIWLELIHRYLGYGSRHLKYLRDGQS